MQNDRFSEFEQTLNAIKYKVAFEKLELIKTLNELSNVSTMKLALKAKRLRIEFNFRKIQIELNKLEIFILIKVQILMNKNIDEKIVIEFINSSLI